MNALTVRLYGLVPTPVPARYPGRDPPSAARAILAISFLFLLLSCSTRERPAVTARLRLTPPDGEAARFAETQVQAIRSEPVIAAALRNPKIAALGALKAQQDPIEWVRKELRVEVSQNSDLVNVSLALDDPREAAAVVNSVVRAYLHEVTDAERKEKMARLKELERTHAEMENQLQKKWADYRRSAEETGCIEADPPTTEQYFVIQQASRARMTVMRIQFELSRAKDDLAAGKALLKTCIGTRDRAGLEKDVAGLEKDVKRLDAHFAVLTDQLKACKAEETRWQAELDKFAKYYIGQEDHLRADHEQIKRIMITIAEERERVKAELQAPPRVTFVREAVPPGQTE